MSLDYDETERALLRAARTERPRTDLRAKALAAAAMTSTTAIVASTLGGKATAGATKVGIGGLLSWASLGARVLTSKGLLVCATLVAVAGVATREARLFEAQSPSYLAPRPVVPMTVKVSSKASGVARAGALEAHSVKTAPLDAPTSEPTLLAKESRGLIPARQERGTAKVQTPEAKPASPSASSVGSQNPQSAEAPARPSQALGEELRLVDSARTALARGDANGALRAIDDHAVRFPSGAFTMERESLRVSALVTLGRRDEAKKAAAVFLASYPKSAAASRMATLLGE